MVRVDEFGSSKQLNGFHSVGKLDDILKKIQANTMSGSTGKSVLRDMSALSIFARRAVSMATMTAGGPSLIGVGVD